MGGPEDGTQPVGRGSDLGGSLDETLLGDPADLHETEAVGAAKGKGARSAGGSAAEASANARTRQTARPGTMTDPNAPTTAVPTAAGSAKAARGPAWMRQTTGAVKHGADRGADVADAVYGRIQRITGADGAGESGLSHVIELNAVVATGDLLIKIGRAHV